MTSVSLSDLLLISDVLDETNLKPIWERIRGYCMRMLFILSFLITFVVESSKLERCVSPSATNMSLSTSDMNYVNNICYQKLDPKIRYAGIFALAACTVMYALFNWWQLVPSVISGFREARKVDQIFRDFHLSLTEIKDIASKPHASLAESHKTQDYRQSYTSDPVKEGNVTRTPDSDANKGPESDPQDSQSCRLDTSPPEKNKKKTPDPDAANDSESDHLLDESFHTDDPGASNDGNTAKPQAHDKTFVSKSATRGVHGSEEGESVFCEPRKKRQNSTSMPSTSRTNRNAHQNSKESPAKAIQNCCALLFFRKGAFTIPVYYLISSVLGCLSAIAVFALIMHFWVVETAAKKSIYVCNLSEEESLFQLTEFRCTNNIKLGIYPYAISFLIGLGLMFMSSFFGVCATVFHFSRLNPDGDASDDAKRLNNDYVFINTCGLWSHQLHEPTAWLLSCQNSWLKRMKKNLTEIIETGDTNFVSLFVHMRKNGTESVVAVILTQPDKVERIKQFPKIFEYARRRGDYKSFFELHDALIDEKNKRASGIWSLECTCKKLKLSTTKEQNMHLRRILLTETSKKLDTVSHLLYWMHENYPNIKADRKLQSDITGTKNYTKDEKNTLFQILAERHLLSQDEADKLKESRGASGSAV